MTSAPRLRLTRPAVLGGFDGCASLIGVVVYLALTRPDLIFATACSGAASAAVSMGGGQYLSDSRSGLAAAAVMTAATATGALAPAIPFAFGHGTTAIIACAAICTAVVVTVAALRSDCGRGRALAETAALFTASVAVAFACTRLIPAGTA